MLLGFMACVSCLHTDLCTRLATHPRGQAARPGLAKMISESFIATTFFCVHVQ